MRVFVSLEKGFHLAKPHCFRCGDCCMRIPPEVTKEEIEIIKLHLNRKERRLFLDSLTIDPTEAQKIDMIPLPLEKGVAWIKVPCPFLDFETRKGRKRAVCKIYKVRPYICRIFWCEKEDVDEPLDSARYAYELSKDDIKRLYTEKGKFYQFAKKIGLRLEEE